MQGAQAAHKVDGDLTIHIDACTPGHRFTTQGLSSCSLDTTVLGNHSIPFFLSDTSLAVTSSIATRTIIVHPLCPSEEELCADLSCSASGYCFGSTVAERKENTSPQLHLRTGEQARVYVPRGTQYSYCNTTSDVTDPMAGSDTTVGRLCEKGPVAFDEEDGLIAHRVLACPPPECLSFGCPGHELQTKGLAGCGVSTENAPIGTSFNISYTIFDSHRPAASASLLRTIIVMSPCASSETYCPDRAVKCAATPCGLRDAIDEPEEVYVPPEIVVDLSGIPSDSAQLVEAPGTIPGLTVSTICGEAPPLDFTNVCGAANQGDLQESSWHQCSERAGECALSALQHTASDPDPLVARIKRHNRGCQSGDASCDVECSLAAVATGRCSPSRQSFSMHAFHATGSASAGAVNTPMLLVHIEIVKAQAAASITMNVTVSSNATVLDIGAIASKATGTTDCSAVATDVHVILRQHVDSAAACSDLSVEAAAAADSESPTGGHVVLVTQVTDSHVLPSAAVPQVSNNLTVVGSLKLQVSVTIGADVRNSTTEASIASTPGNMSALQSAAVSCLASLQSTDLQGSWTNFDAVNVSLEQHTAVPASFVLSIGDVSVAAAQCPHLSAEELAVDATVAVVEDAHMQQLMLGEMVCLR